MPADIIRHIINYLTEQDEEKLFKSSYKLLNFMINSGYICSQNKGNLIINDTYRNQIINGILKYGLNFRDIKEITLDKIAISSRYGYGLDEETIHYLMVALPSTKIYIENKKRSTEIQKNMVGHTTYTPICNKCNEEMEWIHSNRNFCDLCRYNPRYFRSDYYFRCKKCDLDICKRCTMIMKHNQLIDDKSIDDHPQKSTCAKQMGKLELVQSLCIPYPFNDVSNMAFHGDWIIASEEKIIFLMNIKSCKKYRFNFNDRMTNSQRLGQFKFSPNGQFVAVSSFHSQIFALIDLVKGPTETTIMLPIQLGYFVWTADSSRIIFRVTKHSYYWNLHGRAPIEEKDDFAYLEIPSFNFKRNLVTCYGKGFFQITGNNHYIGVSCRNLVIENTLNGKYSRHHCCELHAEDKHATVSPSGRYFAFWSCGIIVYDSENDIYTNYTYLPDGTYKEYKGTRLLWVSDSDLLIKTYEHGIWILDVTKRDGLSCGSKYDFIGTNKNMHQLIVEFLGRKGKFYRCAELAAYQRKIAIHTTDKEGYSTIKIYNIKIPQKQKY